LESATIAVTTDVIRSVDRRIIGLNIDYLVDHDGNRPAGARPLEEALREIGVKSLRFPGGDKSDNHLWSLPPFDGPNPALACGPRQGREAHLMTDGEWNVERMDFDEFMQLCRRLGAEPTCVVCYDALFTPGCTVTKQQLIDTAAAWVEYANLKRGYGVRYWEIGNEGYIDATVSPYDYAQDFVEFAQAMKAVDPSIITAPNGPPRAEGSGRHEATKDVPWWKVLYETAAEHIDVISIHSYSCWQWGSYEAYRDHGPGYPEAFRDALSPLEAARKYGFPDLADRLRLAVTETNAADWSENGWPKVNDLGHALVAFDLFGTFLETEPIDMAQLWNTRWVSHPDTPSLWDAVDDYNRLQPTGQALAIWSRYLGDEMIRLSEPPRMRTFASRDAKTGRLAVFLLNKDRDAREVELELPLKPASARRATFRGTGPEDFHPTLTDPTPIPHDPVRVELPPDSLTIIEVMP
jgi:alpha-N-arabinofuranosidase